LQVKNSDLESPMPSTMQKTTNPSTGIKEKEGPLDNKL
jgi:hypothetical protein